MIKYKIVRKTLQVCTWMACFAMVFSILFHSAPETNLQQTLSILSDTELTRVPEDNHLEILTYGLISSLFMMGIMGFCLSIFAQKTFKRFRHIKNAIFYLSLFIMVSSVWLLTNLHILNAIGKQSIYKDIEIILFYSIPITFWCFMKEVFKRYRKILISMKCTVTIFLVIVLALKTVWGIGLYKWLPYFYILLLIEMILIIVVSWPFAMDNNKSHLMLFCGVIVLDIFCFVDMLLVYMSFINREFSWMFVIGIYLFIFFLSLGLLYQIKHQIIESMTSEIYKELAYTDILTKLGNRTKFEENFYLRYKGSDKGDITVGMVDINNLKCINDTMGHKVGDEAIRLVSDHLQKLFCGIGEIYRIGGDEFVITFCGVGSDLVQQTFEEFCKCMEEESEKRPYDISVAVGHCSYQPQKHNSLKDLFENADKNMYENKRQVKQARLSC